MNARASVLIRTRLQRPKLPPGWTVQGPLRDQLDTSPQHRLIQVLAPAGFGKSLNLAAWADRVDGREADVAWMRVESGDGGLATVAAYLHAALAMLPSPASASPRTAAGSAPAAPLPQRGRRILSPGLSQPDDPRQLISLILAALVERGEACQHDQRARPLVLVVDDAHCLEEMVVGELFLRLLREAPEAFHVVWLTRGPGLAIPSELQARGHVLQIGPASLRIQAEAAAVFAHTVLGTPCPDDTLAFAMRLTEGWPLAFQLVLRQLRPPFDLRTSTARLPAVLAELERFLEAEVLAGLSPRLIDFLRLTSVSMDLSPALADCLGGGDDGVECLLGLQGLGLLVAVDPASPEMFRTEALLRRCLGERLAREAPGRALLLHRRAAGWHAAHGHWQTAVGHALEGGDASQAAAWIEHGAESLLEQGDFQALLDWIERLPAEALAARPRLQLVKAWAEVFLHRRADADHTLTHLEAHLRELERDALAIRSAMTALGDDSAAALLAGQRVLARAPRPGSLADHAAQTAIIFGLGAASRFDEVEALRASQTDLPALTSQAALYRQNLFAYSAFQAGRLDQAGLIFEEVLAHEVHAKVAARGTAAVAAAYLAAIHYERNDPERARALLSGRRAAIEASASLGAVLHGLRTSARLAFLDGDLEQGLQILEEGASLGRRRGQVRLQVGCLAEAARLRLVHGDTLEADRLLRTLLALGVRAPDDRATAASESWDMVRLAEGRMLLAVNAPRRAVPLLRVLWDDLRHARRSYLAVGVAVVLVRALEAAGEPESALDPLWQGLTYGQQNGLVRTFADEGLALAGPLARLLPGGVVPPEVDREYLRRIRLLLDPVYARQILASPASPASPASQGGPRAGLPAGSAIASAAPGLPARDVQASGVSGAQPRLSARETEILQYMARGLSNKEIARALGISPETVKWYLKHIYDKLQVSGRVQAVQVGLGIRVTGSGDADAESMHGSPSGGEDKRPEAE